jgi:hypothetical protein
MIVRAQTGGTFSGSLVVQGGSGDSGRNCSVVSSFTAQMAPDGTLISFDPSDRFAVGCTVGFEASVTGAATDTAIQINLMHHSICMDPFGQLRDTDRTLTMSVRRAPWS